MIKLKGLKEVNRQIRKLERDSEKAINKGVQETARLILSDALARVPVDKGLLKASMGIETMPEEMQAKVFAAAAHAAWTEFGTGSFVEVPTGYEDYAMEFFVSGKGKGHPQPFMFPAMFANQEKLIPLIEAELIKLLRK